MSRVKSGSTQEHCPDLWKKKEKKEEGNTAVCGGTWFSVFLKTNKSKTQWRIKPKLTSHIKKRRLIRFIVS